MKHIFTIHSHITLLASLGTIVLEKLETTDVILICSGGYKPKLNESFKGKIVSSLDDRMTKVSLLERMRSFNYTKLVDRYIDSIADDSEYIAYVDIMSVFNRYLVMHVNCRQFHLIEEGIVNYGDFDDFNLLTIDLRKFKWKWNWISDFPEMIRACQRLLKGRSLRMLALPVHPNVYGTFEGVSIYCFSALAFANIKMERKKLLSFVGLQNYFSSAPPSYSEGSWFWIGDTLCKTYGIATEHFRTAVYELLSRISVGPDEKLIHVKFRGSETEVEQQIIVEALKAHNFKIELMAKNEIIEMVFLQGESFNVCGVSSSLLIYANLMGHKTYSCLRYIPNIYGVSIVSKYPTIGKKVGLVG